MEYSEFSRGEGGYPREEGCVEADKCSVGCIDIIRKAFLKNPLFYYYLYYDVVFEKGKTKICLKIKDGEIKGYVLVYDNGCLHVHVVGDVGGPPLPEPMPCGTMHFEASAGAKPPLRGRWEQALVMYCDASCLPAVVRHLRPGEGVEVRLLGRGDLAQYVRLNPRLKDVDFSKVLTYGVFYKGELVSVASASVRLDELWVISNVYTSPDYRGRGYGTLATARATYEALRRGALAVLSVLEENVVAVKLYRKLGFKAVRTFRIAVVGTRV